MRKSILTLVASVSLFLWAGMSVSAQEKLTSSQLRALGVETSTLQPITFSHDSRTVVCFDRAPFEEKKDGTFFRLWFFKIQPDGRLGTARSVNLPLKNLQQGEFTPDDSRFVVLGNRGTTYLSVRTDNLKVEELMTPEWGIAGFRGDPPVLWSQGGKLFTTGHFYDRERFVEPTTVATINPQADPGSRFQRGPNIAALEKSLERLWVTNYASDQSAFFGQKLPHATVLSHWDGNRVREFDRASKFSGFWGAAGRLLYSRKSTPLSENELVVFDSTTGNLKVVERSEQDYRYLFLSRDGRTLLTSRLIPGQDRVETYYAREQENWELKPMIRDRNNRPVSTATGWMRISSDGKWTCYVGSGGIVLYPLP